METRRFLNNAQPRSLFLAQFALYAGGIYAVVHAVASGRSVGVPLLWCFFAVIAAYGLSNEGKWAYWFGLIVSAAALVYEIYVIVREPVLAIRPDMWVLVALPIATIWLLTSPSSRDFAKIWFS